MMEKTAVYRPHNGSWQIRVFYREQSRQYSVDRELSVGRPTPKNQPDIPVESPIVSRRHGRFFMDGERFFYEDLGSKNGTFLNGLPLPPKSPVELQDGDRLMVQGTEDAEHVFDVLLIPILRGQVIPTAKKPSSPRLAAAAPVHGALSINIRERSVWYRAKKKCLLKDIRLEIPQGNLVLILAGSGAGKTTFMNAVMGYEPAEGTILYRGRNLYTEFEEMKYEIGYVPQQDLLRMSDTVYDTLENSARMRLPATTPDAEREKSIVRTLHLFALEREKDNQVSKLSGGQRKRLSIAVEYIGNPSLFFLDEPDSGLDGTMSAALFQNLRQIADEGKTVLVISHSPDRVINMIDRVIVLAKSRRDDIGHLAFYGTVPEACAFFDTGRSLEKIVQRLNREEEGGEGKADLYIDRFQRGRKQ